MKQFKVAWERFADDEANLTKFLKAKRKWRYMSAPILFWTKTTNFNLLRARSDSVDLRETALPTVPRMLQSAEKATGDSGYWQPNSFAPHNAASRFGQNAGQTTSSNGQGP
jgi:hypothetical protein